MAAPDPRFGLSQFDQPGPSSKPESSNSDSRGHATDRAEAAPQQGNGKQAQPESHKVLAPLSSAELEAYKKKESKKGIIYISHIPHGMTVAKVRHLLEQFGPVERIFLHDPRSDNQPQHHHRKRSKGTAHFEEGWVEFTSKKVAKSVAALLNAQPLGAAAVTKSSMKARKNGPKGLKFSRRFTDEVWTMKYLPGFKWHMLTEQLSSERASRAARLRAELSQSQFEQSDYLRKVERARVVQEKKARKGLSGAADTPDETHQDAGTEAKKARTFKQREAILHDVRDQRSDTNKRPATEEAGPKRKKPKVDTQRAQALDNVLDSIF